MRVTTAPSTGVASTTPTAPPAPVDDGMSVEGYEDLEAQMSMAPAVTFTAPRTNGGAGTLRANQKEAYDAAIAEGLSPTAARALVANMTGESLAKPTDSHFDVHHNSQGIVQWDPARSAAIKEKFGKEPKDMSVAEQTKAAIWEMKNKYPKTWDALQGSDPKAMMTMLVRDYERPANAAGEIEKRMRHYEGLGGLDSMAPPSASSAGPVPDTADGLQRGATGPAVAGLQTALNAYGASPPLAIDGDFGARTERALRLMQHDLGVPVTGTLDPATIDAMGKRPPGDFNVQRTAVPSVAGSNAERLAEAARDAAERRHTVGRCAGGVGDALAAIGVKLRVPSAYMYAEKLADDPRFQEVFYDRSQLKELPPGAIVVWGKSGNHPHGHVAITVGDGKEASDHVQNIRGGSYGGQWGNGVTTEQNFRVFVPTEEQ